LTPERVHLKQAVHASGARAARRSAELRFIAQVGCRRHRILDASFARIRTGLSSNAACGVLGLAGCERSTLHDSASTGLNPKLPAPTHSLLPTVNIAPAKGWPQDSAPTAAASLSVRAFAKDLEHPRWHYVLPNGDVLAAESDGPPRPEDRKGIRGWIYGWALKRAGAGVASPNKIILHYAKIAFGKYFVRKIRRDTSEPFYERVVLDRLGIRKVKETA
jgi:hypothetical protein